jgi:hypothetical protein
MSFNFTSFLSDVGGGLGSFLSAIQEPLVYFILVLGIGGAVAGIVWAIVERIKKGMK